MGIDQGIGDYEKVLYHVGEAVARSRPLDAADVSLDDMTR